MQLIVSSSIHCGWRISDVEGACLTVNLTREGETEPSGVLRDCLDSHKRVKNRLELKKGHSPIQYSATYCACMGHHCNVDGTPLANREEEQMSRGGERRRGKSFEF
ncbi:hypothetical protein PMAYCL1PPCAC_30207 [Pristionchus mayeri]|uniref:Uncharacterized protein n=1 Tax=Pristionchus mayeri TaxID=1317129 RepID=A0AAN5IBI6_9BILA|nr:hypothetical protein PMAYCL1PPCAC_30207 [Pristionchus mayeri]